MIFPGKPDHAALECGPPKEGGPRAALAAATSGYLGADAALPGCVWSETPPRFCLKRKTKLFNFLACFCRNLFQVIVIFLGFFPLLNPKLCVSLAGRLGGLDAARVYELLVRDVQHPEGINEPLTMPSLLRSAEKMLPVLCVLFACFY